MLRQCRSACPRYGYGHISSRGHNRLLFIIQWLDRIVSRYSLWMTHWPSRYSLWMTHWPGGHSLGIAHCPGRYSLWMAYWQVDIHCGWHIGRQIFTMDGSLARQIFTIDGTLARGIFTVDGTLAFRYQINLYVTECIVYMFRAIPFKLFFPVLFLFDWVGFLWPNYLRC